MRIKTKLEKNYKVFHELVPQEGKILDIGCGYGFMAYMLHFTAAKRIITGIDYDEEKIETANHCFSKSDNVNFIHSDVLSFNFEKYDAIIMADILHYLQPDEQKQVIEKCMQQLNDGGIVIIRDGDKDTAKAHKKTELTEFFSTRVFKFNKIADKGISFLSAKFIREMAAQYKMECREISDSEITSNTIFVLKKMQEDKA
jgi:2-polyprenyl-3-methyl-5-hydroxy-6-metoxy-1,4-benzoquinol methylase